MLNYTRGEWQTAGEAKDFVYCLNSNGINRFSLLVQGGYTENAKTSKHELEANAQLICSAPDMYEALKELSNYHPKQGYEQWLILQNKANRAIAKSEGR